MHQLKMSEFRACTDYNCSEAHETSNLSHVFGVKVFKLLFYPLGFNNVPTFEGFPQLLLHSDLRMGFFELVKCCHINLINLGFQVVKAIFCHIRYKSGSRIIEIRRWVLSLSLSLIYTLWRQTLYGE